MRFYYMDGERKVYLTLKKGSPEWCNLDCPTIKLEGDPSRWPGWNVLHYLILEDGNDEFYPLVRSFVKKSSEAFYRKFPDMRKDRNGFLENFDNGILKYHRSLVK